MQSPFSKEAQPTRRSRYSQKSRNEQAVLKKQTAFDQTQSETDPLYFWKKEARLRFFRHLVAEVQEKGPETLDRAWTFYPQDISLEDLDQGDSVDLKNLHVIKDDFFLPKIHSFAPTFFNLVQQEWWSNRKEVIHQEGEASVSALCGFYGRYLGSSGLYLTES